MLILFESDTPDSSLNESHAEIADIDGVVRVVVVDQGEIQAKVEAVLAGQPELIESVLAVGLPRWIRVLVDDPAVLDRVEATAQTQPGFREIARPDRQVARTLELGIPTDLEEWCDIEI